MQQAGSDPKKKLVTGRRALIALGVAAWLAVAFIGARQQAESEMREEMRAAGAGTHAPESAQAPGAERYDPQGFYISISGPPKRMEAQVNMRPDDERYGRRLPLDQYLKTAREVEMLTVAFSEEGVELWTMLQMTGEVEFRLPAECSTDLRAYTAAKLREVEGVREVKEGLAELDTAALTKAMKGER
jgi:hypothetical protein